METAFAIIAAGALLCWFFLRRKGQIPFWNKALRHPDRAYDFFKSKDCWQVFESLPPDFRNTVPHKEWVGPFPMSVPRLGNKKVWVFGKREGYRASQVEFLNHLNSELER